MTRINIHSAVVFLLLSMLAATAFAHHKPHREHAKKFVYIPGGPDSEFILQYRVDVRGKRIPLSPPSMSVRGTVYSLVVAPNRKSVYVPEGDYSDVAQFHVLRDGTLFPMQSPEIVADAHPTFMVLDTGGRHAYVSCSHGDVCQYRVDRDGSLVPLTPPAVLVSAFGGRDPSPVIFDSSGKRAIVLVSCTDGTFDSTVQFRFRVKPDGTLVEISRSILEIHRDKGV